jgi:hypothetical protein
VSDDAFKGIKLSENVGSSVDQRLFAAPAKPKPATKAPVVAKPVEASTATPAAEPVVPPLALPIASSRSERPLSEPTTREKASFDINERPWHKGSFLFTDTEFEQLEDLKLELRRRYDLDATKNDIVRTAVHQLLEDYGRDADKSTVVRHLRKKTS